MRPHLRIRDAAEQLGVSELELRATELGPQRTGERGAIRLRSDSIRTLLGELERLGEVMALTRNAWAVHEKIGRWAPLTLGPEFGLVLGGAVDLRLFMNHWAHAIAVTELFDGPSLRHSVHFFDASGDAIHKVYMRSSDDVSEFVQLVDRHRSEHQHAWQLVEPHPELPKRPPNQAIDVHEFHAAWLALRDTHDFSPMLSRFAIGRTQALRLAPPEHATPVGRDSLTKLLQRTSEAGTSIMVFVANRGCLQIHTGPIGRVVPLGPWINVMDPDFNLHVRADAIAESWIVRKPTDDGIVTSLELFDSTGETIALLFGARKPGIPEQEAWRELVAELPAAPR
jgi:putative hemin transport protein